MSDELRKAARELLDALSDVWVEERIGGAASRECRAESALRAALATEPSREPTQEMIEAWLNAVWEYAEQHGATIGACTKQFAALAYAAGHKAENQSPTWQPIETAPKDGTKVLLCQCDGLHGEIEIDTGTWERPTYLRYEEIENGLFHRREVSCEGYWNANSAQHPDYWMPLPPPPKAGSGT